MSDCLLIKKRDLQKLPKIRTVYINDCGELILKFDKGY